MSLGGRRDRSLSWLTSFLPGGGADGDDDDDDDDDDDAGADHDDDDKDKICKSWQVCFESEVSGPGPGSHFAGDDIQHGRE